MYSLNEQQLDFYSRRYKSTRRQARKPSIRSAFDHICIIIEHKLEDEEDFQLCYEATIQTFYRQELREIEDETRFLLACRNWLTLSRSQFFLLLFTIFIGPFIGCDLAWLMTNGPKAGWTMPLNVWAPISVVYSLFPAPDPIGPAVNAGAIGPAHIREVKSPVGDKAFYKIRLPDTPG